MRTSAPLPDESLDYNQCQEAVRRLTDYLSHELPADEEAEVAHHLDECRGCFAKFHFEETLLHTIQQRLREVHAPLSMRTRVLEMLMSPEATALIAPPLPLAD